MWAEFEWENKVAINTNISDLRDFLQHIVTNTNMTCLSPLGDGDAVSLFCVCMGGFIRTDEPRGNLRFFTNSVSSTYFPFQFRRMSWGRISLPQTSSPAPYLARMH
jgi:hypothetical protein